LARQRRPTGVPNQSVIVMGGFYPTENRG
jgi:hypothetical protein